MRSYKPYIIKLCIVFLCFGGWILTSSAQKVETNDYFYVLNTQQGLSDNRVLQMMQLADGRLAVRTPKDINLYDGRRFSLISLPAEKAECITKYKGQTLDAGKRLLKKEKSGYFHKGNNHLFLYYSCSYTLTSTSPFLFSRFHRYTSRCSSPWLELSVADHLQNIERLP